METTNTEPSSEHKHHMHAVSNHQLPHRRRRLRNCLLVTVAVIIAVFLLILILALTVFRPRHAVSKVNSVKLGGLKVGLNIPNFSVDLNVTLDLDISVYNPNRAGFRYPDGGSAEMYYRSTLAGDAAIPPGEIGPRGTERIEVALTVLAGKLAWDGAVYADIMAGSLGMTTHTTISGVVSVLGFIKKHVVSYTTCDVTVDVRNRTVSNSDCRYKTKL